MDWQHDEVVRVASGPTVQVELWQQVLKDAGIDSRVVGEDLNASFGTALSRATELWVHKSDYDRALKLLEEAEAEAAERDRESGEGEE